MPNNIVYIDLLRPGSFIDANGPFWTSPSQAAEERSLVERGCRIVRASNYPRHLCDVDPTITFLSHSLSDARSYFTVHLGDRLIFSESTTLELIDPDDPSTSNVDGILYKTSLVPGFWDTISQSPDASQYTIIQRVIQDTCSSSSPPFFSAMYKFLYQSSTPTVENFSISNMLSAEPAVQNNEFCLESLLSMEADAFPDSDMMEFVKSPDFFDIDFIMPDWSEQSSPDHSVFSSPGQYPRVVNGVVPDEDVQLLLPASSIEIDMPPNYL
jgi:transcriptional enhancer factor